MRCRRLFARFNSTRVFYQALEGLLVDAGAVQLVVLEIEFPESTRSSEERCQADASQSVATQIDAI